MIHNALYQHKGLLGRVRLLFFAFEIKEGILRVSNLLPGKQGILFLDSRAAHLREKLAVLLTNKSTWLGLEIYQDSSYSLKSLAKIYFLVCSSVGLFWPRYFLFRYFNSLLRYRDKFDNLRTLVFYEKSLLSMSVYVISRKFEVLQHGVPTSTYFPSLAEVYHIWSTDYLEHFRKRTKSDLKISGRLISNLEIVSGSWDLVFLSQIGSSSDLKQLLDRVKLFIISLSKDYSILVRLHPSENVDSWHALGDCSRMTFRSGNYVVENCDHAEPIYCSLYSTALIDMIYLGKRAFRFAVDDFLNEDNFVMTSKLIPKYCIGRDNLESFLLSLSFSRLVIPKNLNLDRI